jgi:hypothetical protein
MTKKTVTIDLTFKKWMKFALIAVFFLLLSFGLMTCARAQGGGGGGGVLTGTTVYSVGNYPQNYEKVSTVEKGDPAIDTFRRVWFASFSVVFGLVSIAMVIAAIGTWQENDE